MARSLAAVSKQPLGIERVRNIMKFLIEGLGFRRKAWPSEE